MGGENTNNTIGPLYTGEGKIANQDVAHEMYNQTVADWEDEGAEESGATKIGYFDVHGAHKRAIQRAYNTVQLEEAARIDPKTGLPNDVEFAVQLSNVLEQVRSGELPGFGVAMLDLDTFGWMNDFFNGHDFGDLFLRHGANRMKKHVRETDYLFRRSGDEFYVLFDGLTDKDKLRERLKDLSQDFRAHAFRDTIESAIHSSRRVQIPGGKVERDGVYALQNILRGLLIVQSDETKQQFFIKDAKGLEEEKIRLIDKVKALDLKRFRPLVDLADKTTFDLNAIEFIGYQILLGQFAGKVIELFDTITLSCGAMVITGENIADAPVIRQNLDTAMYEVKNHGRNNIKIL